MNASDTRAISDAVTGSILPTSSLYLYVDRRIQEEAQRGGSWLIDPLGGIDKAFPNDEQDSLWLALRSLGFYVSDTNDSVPSGSFKGAPTKRVSWAITPTPSVTPTITPTPVVSMTVTPSLTFGATPTPTPGPTTTPTVTSYPTPTPTRTPDPTVTPTLTTTPTPNA